MIKEVPFYEVVCDKCGSKFEEPYFGMSVFPTALSAEKTARSLGWTIEKDKTICDKCSCKKEDVIVVNYNGKCPF